MESKFLSKYCDEDNLDEDKMTEDMATLLVSIVMKEKRLQKEVEDIEKEKSIDVFVEYLQKRKELAEKYIEKIKQTEKERENENND